MSKEKLETEAMLNPKCQKCPKKDTCNDKTLCLLKLFDLIKAKLAEKVEDK